ncbi:MAG: alpha/beta hydrolase-fold protein [Erythrobacter sp.]|jgi:predicted alpha/beta superfamily hydrolase|uniref:alpha/beta hydrolase n=1 Tax=Erythrobacter sp. TaxID=1042 RepID=UPI002B4A0EB0|nr:alpha/beta hydrolase-fold protein [Erythrobacter sp.]WRH70688.1 MAG: alpha/beta hydrolase-fold protein [Erythrobacter sp.]
MTHPRTDWTRAALAALALTAAAVGQAQSPEPQPLTIGETVTLDALGEAREVNIVLPLGYGEEPDKRWPVVYLLDGGEAQDLFMGAGLQRWNTIWGRSKDAIIVGIATRNRQRELLPPTADEAEAKRYPTAGQSAAFRAWIADIVKPMVEARFRTDGTSVLVGESAAGHFVVETWATAPAMFTGYAAISPSLQWDFEALSRKPLGEGKRPPLYLSLADEGGATETGMMRLLSSLPPSQPYCFSDRRTELRHATSLHGLLPEALQYLLPTGADYLEEYGMVLRCEKRGG